MKRAAIAALLLATAGAPVAAQDIDTRTGGSIDAYNAQAASWNQNGTQFNAGQVFRTFGSENVLDRFSLFLNNYRDIACCSETHPGDYEFRAYIAEFNPSFGTMTSSAFWSSAIQSTAGLTTDFTEYSFNTGGLVLDPTKYYIAYVSAAGLTNPHPGDVTAAGLERVTNGSYTDGMAAADLTGAGGPGTSDIWTEYQPLDLAFTADFSSQSQNNVAPEPVSLTLLATGLAGVGAARRRRRKV